MYHVSGKSKVAMDALARAPCVFLTRVDDDDILEVIFQMLILDSGKFPTFGSSR